MAKQVYKAPKRPRKLPDAPLPPRAIRSTQGALAVASLRKKKW